MIAPFPPSSAEAVPIAEMAAHLAGHDPSERDTPETAAVLLKEYGYRARAIDAGIEAALALVRTGIRAAASDHPVALAVGRARDLAACAVLLIGACHAWGGLS